MAHSAYVENIRLTIKRLLKNNRMTYRDLADGIGVSENTIKLQMKKGQWTVERLELVAAWFGFSLMDFMQLVHQNQSEVFELNSEQEKILSHNPLAFHLMLLLAVGFDINEAVLRSGAQKKSIYKALFALDKCGIVELLPGDQVRVCHRGPYRFSQRAREQNPFFTAYLDLLKSLIAKIPSDQVLQRTFELYVSDRLYEQMKKELQALLAKYAHLSRLETGLVDTKELYPVNGLFLLKPYDAWGEVLKKFNKN